MNDRPYTISSERENGAMYALLHVLDLPSCRAMSASYTYRAINYNYACLGSLRPLFGESITA